MRVRTVSVSRSRGVPSLRMCSASRSSPRAATKTSAAMSSDTTASARVQPKQQQGERPDHDGRVGERVGDDVQRGALDAEAAAGAAQQPGDGDVAGQGEQPTTSTGTGGHQRRVLEARDRAGGDDRGDDHAAPPR